MRHLAGGESLRLQPADHRPDIVLADTEPVGELFRRKPSMVLRRTRIPLLIEQPLQFGSLSERRIEKQSHRRKRKISIHASTIVSQQRHRAQIPVERYHLRWINGSGNPILLRVKTSRQQEQGQRDLAWMSHIHVSDHHEVLRRLNERRASARKRSRS
jgi:hypothetical protein